MEKRTTNEEFIAELMNFSKFGALSQMFIVEAIANYSQQVIEAGAEKVNTPFIKGESWVGVAKEIFEKIEKRYADA